MFCNQCEQTSKGTGCTRVGVCGKSEDVAHQQDTLVQALRWLALTALQARAKGIVDAATDRHAAHALFATLTNVNFDQDDLAALTRETLHLRRELATRAGCPEAGDSEEAALAQLRGAVRSPDQFAEDANVRSAMQLLLYGCKGVAAYAEHAAILGQSDPEVYANMYAGLAAGFDGKQRGLEDWVNLLMDCGRTNLRTMELLDTANTSTYGDPVPTEVRLGHRKGKCILISGHDLKDVYDVLKATEGTGINVYSHGEILPAHAYPKLHAFPHFVGHFGTAWQNQTRELPDFPGAVLFTTNCIQNPKDYADKVFTTGVVGWPGLTHCPHGDFSALIKKALELPGFAEDTDQGSVLTGFGRATLLGAAPQVLDAVKGGALKHIFLVGGCDGAKPGRSYYSDFVEQTPPDSLVLTLACGKFRFFDKKLGNIGPFPRLMDVGQCNDAFSAVKVALALAEALNCQVNDLPLHIVLSWYEQKAVAILLTLLALGVKNIKIGPSLPAFVSPDVLNLLVTQWNVAPVSTPEADLKQMLG